MIAIALASCLATATLSIPTGYYTVRELAVKLADQGVPARASDDCAEDVYAIRIDHLEWPAVKRSLAADDRLTITEADGVWKIQRNYATKLAEDAACRRYIGMTADLLQSVYGPVARELRQLASLQEPEKGRRMDAYRTARDAKDPVQRAAREALYLCYESELPFGVIGYLAAATQARDSAFNHTYETDLASFPEIMTPGGTLRDIRLPMIDVDKVSDSELIGFGRNIGIVFRLALEPLTLACTCRMTSYTKSGTFMTLGSMRGNVIPGRTDLEIAVKPAEVFRTEEAQRLSSRIAATARLRDSTPLVTVQAQLPDRAMPVSEALLRCADASKCNLVSYVSQFGDLPLAKVERGSLAQILNLSEASVDPGWWSVSSAERIGDDSGMSVLASRLPRILTGSLSDDVLVVQNELRFLDGFCDSPRGFSTALINRRLKEGLASLTEVCDEVAELKVGQWKGSVFAGTYLEHCNPLSFRPFALALKESAKLREIVRTLPDGKTVTFPLAELESRARAALEKGLAESVRLVDAGSVRVESFFGGDVARDPRVRNLELSIFRSGNRYGFSYAGGMWETWLNNVRPDETELATFASREPLEGTFSQ